MAFISLPVTSEGQLLDPLTANVSVEEFNDFYSNYINDKYLVDYVLTQNGIDVDTLDIADFHN